MGGFFIAGNDGEWKSIGVISEDGITLSTSDDEPRRVGEPPLEHIKGEFTAAISHVDKDALDCFFTLPEVGQKAAIMLEYVRKRRSDLLRERAEAVGGKFLRHYLRSQRISRANTGTKQYAAGGIMRTRVIFPGVTIRA